MQDTSNNSYSFARLFHHPCNDLLGIAALYTLRHWHRFKPGELASLLWSLALLKACPPETWHMLLERLGQTPLSAFAAAEHCQLFQTYLLLDTSTKACERQPA